MVISGGRSKFVHASIGGEFSLWLQMAAQDPTARDQIASATIPEFLPLPHEPIPDIASTPEHTPWQTVLFSQNIRLPFRVAGDPHISRLPMRVKTVVD